jgi:phenylpropionate dioxygenase-like ring-hydroxylating dioxygenase large terminal subunit
MLTREDNITLTHVEAGTPLGRFFRSYWIPAAKLEEITEPGGAPVRVGLLGEKLVAFRDPSGKAGLVGEFCPHRRASLVYGRNEEGGLRCLYHGWKMGHAGQILETPAEPKGSKLAANLRHISYPVREAGGLLWTYMGPREQEPPFPRFPWLDLPASQLLVVKMYQDSNYLQGLEGDLDPAHPNYLHRDFELDDSKSWSAAGWQSIANLMSDGAPAIHCEETPYLMRVAAVRTTNDPKVNYVRTTEWIAPFYTYIATGPHESRLFKAWLPIDNERCFTFYIHYNPHHALNLPAIYANWGHRTEAPDYRTAHTKENMHLQDRRKMKSNFSGVDGAAIQDRVVQESMGPICDRTKENLVSTDNGIIMARHRLMRSVKALMDKGVVPPGVDPAHQKVRSVSIVLPPDQPFKEGAKEALIAKKGVAQTTV